MLARQPARVYHEKDKVGPRHSASMTGIVRPERQAISLGTVSHVSRCTDVSSLVASGCAGLILRPMLFRRTRANIVHGVYDGLRSAGTERLK